MSKNQKTLMSRSLAQALMESSMQHFDPDDPAVQHKSLGGFISGLMGGQAEKPQAQSDYGGIIDQSGKNAMEGYGQSKGIIGQQQNLANMLMEQAQGGGPNPAQLALNQTTGQNINQQAALMAGQRGASANPALLARQAAMLGSNVQQQAAGQGALMQAQQQLAARQQLAGQQAAMQQANLGQQNAMGSMFGTAGGLQNNQNEINSKIDLANAAAAQSASGGLMQGLGTGFAKLGGWDKLSGLISSKANPLADLMGNGGSIVPGQGGATILPATVGLGMTAAHGGVIPDHLSHVQEIYGKFSSGGSPAYSGGYYVPGQAQFQGDSEKNDTVSAMLSPGEIVIPRTIAQSDDAPRRAAEFIRHLEKQDTQKGYKKVLASKKGKK